MMLGDCHPQPTSLKQTPNQTEQFFTIFNWHVLLIAEGFCFSKPPGIYTLLWNAL